ncbi:MAG: hypothetical protein CM1200mP18_17740 [Gammaproteobacteria bacterium]|nr:MAG: hypothetical protein CM1200mP18_17740 [Gammaproteobacteria bacterium]
MRRAVRRPVLEPRGVVMHHGRRGTLLETARWRHCRSLRVYGENSVQHKNADARAVDSFPALCEGCWILVLSDMLKIPC